MFTYVFLVLTGSFNYSRGAVKPDIAMTFMEQPNGIIFFFSCPSSILQMIIERAINLRTNVRTISLTTHFTGPLQSLRKARQTICGSFHIDSTPSVRLHWISKRVQTFARNRLCSPMFAARASSMNVLRAFVTRDFVGS